MHTHIHAAAAVMQTRSLIQVGVSAMSARACKPRMRSSEIAVACSHNSPGHYAIL